MTLLPLLLFAQAVAPVEPAAAPPLPHSEEVSRFEQCADLAIESPEKAIEQANAWRLGGGGFASRQCLGLAYAQLERWVPAAAAFEQAARDAERERNAASANLWLQSGNALLAADQPDRARAAFNAAFAAGSLTGLNRGEAHLDRARALVALGDTASARADIDKALEFAPEDPLAWLLSATLARRMNDLDRAAKDIAEAAKRSPDDASVAYEAGVIAYQSGAPDAARAAWQGAIANQPDSPAAKSAAAALSQLDDNSKPKP